MKKLTLHIGTEKTGTTAIQKFLANKRDFLEKHDIYSPKNAGGYNHRNIATLFMNNGRFDDWHSNLGLFTIEDVKAWKEKNLEIIRNELKKDKKQHHIISSEHFSSRLIHKEEIKNLSEFLNEIYDEINLVMYLRRQDEYACSLYSTTLKSGFNSKTVLPTSPDPDRYDYKLICEKWFKNFTKKNFIIKVYEKNKLHKKNIISDFFNELDININDSDIDKMTKENPSLSILGQEILIRYNRVYPKYIGKKTNHKHEDFVNFLEKTYSGTPRLPKKEFVKEWMKQFKDTNDFVSKHYIIDSISFENNFEKYPNEWITKPTKEEINHQLINIIQELL